MRCLCGAGRRISGPTRDPHVRRFGAYRVFTSGGGGVNRAPQNLGRGGRSGKGLN